MEQHGIYGKNKYFVLLSREYILSYRVIVYTWWVNAYEIFWICLAQSEPWVNVSDAMNVTMIAACGVTHVRGVTGHEVWEIGGHRAWAQDLPWNLDLPSPVYLDLLSFAYFSDIEVIRPSMLVGMLVWKHGYKSSDTCPWLRGKPSYTKGTCKFVLKF